PAQSGAARIPVERSRARWLLLGGAKDEVWASGEMATALGKRLGRRATTVVYPTAGHQICGAGTYPSHIWADASPDPRVKDPTAEGAAQVDAWWRMQAFLKRAL
ncbi:MAG: acyl-CoA thioester hydrolase/BAAT C-terminal domain-containing protein, partial [Pseudomonadota bacterium]